MPARQIRFATAALAACLLAGLAPAQQQVRYDGYHVVRVHAETEEDLMELDALATHLLSESHGHGPTDFLLSPEALIELNDSGVPYIILETDVQAAIDEERARIEASQRSVTRSTWYEDYKTNDQIFQRMDDLIANNPTLVSREVIGASIEGQPIYGYTISGAGDPASKPGVCFNGTIHAREWVSPMTVTYIAEQLISGYGSDPQVTALLDDLTFYIVNVLNPDGYEYSWDAVRLWRKNRRDNGDGTFGVDLNRNWGLGWGGPGASGSTNSDLYYGASPFSEPETQAMRDYILNYTNIVAHIDFHSYSQLILWPYGHDVIDPPADDLAVFETLGTGMAVTIQQTTGAVYAPQIARDLYIASGTSSDWIYDTPGVFSWTFELRPASQFQGGFTLPADQILPTAQENFAAILTLAEAVATGVDFTIVGGAPTIEDATSPDDLLLQISPIFSSALDPATGRLFHRIGDSGPFTQSPLTHLGGEDYSAAFPTGGSCGDAVQYYFEIDSTDATTYRFPRAAPADVIETELTEIDVAFTDDFQSDLGWTVQNGPGLSDGAWTRGVPVGGGDRGDPAADADNSGACYLTDNTDGNSDVDDGSTTLTSPAMDASDPDATLVYSRWFHNSFGGDPFNDVFVVEVSDDDGQSWVNLETVGPGGAEVSGGWFLKEFRVADIPGVANSSTFRVRFIAEDAPDGSVIEAAVDGVEIRSVGCAPAPPGCAGDVNGDGLTNLADFSDLGSNFGATGLPFGNGESRALGDLNDDGSVDLGDFSLLGADFGCTP